MDMLFVYMHNICMLIFYLHSYQLFICLQFTRVYVSFKGDRVPFKAVLQGGFLEKVVEKVLHDMITLALATSKRGQDTALLAWMKVLSLHINSRFGFYKLISLMTNKLPIYVRYLKKQQSH